jgi:hypothetical protein
VVTLLDQVSQNTTNTTPFLVPSILPPNEQAISSKIARPAGIMGLLAAFVTAVTNWRDASHIYRAEKSII